MDLESDKVGLKLKIHVQKSFENNQHSMASLLNNFGIGELNPWLRMFCWHKLSINHMFWLDIPTNQIITTFVFIVFTNYDFDFN
jgi:hypothetical protein